MNEWRCLSESELSQCESGYETVQGGGGGGGGGGAEWANGWVNEWEREPLREPERSVCFVAAWTKSRDSP